MKYDQVTSQLRREKRGVGEEEASGEEERKDSSSVSQFSDELETESKRAD